MKQIAAVLGAMATLLICKAVVAQPGHAPFVFGAMEIEDYERSLAPPGIPGATIVNPNIFNPISIFGNHPCVVGNAPTACLTGAPVFLDRVQSAWEQWGGILGHIGPSLTGNTYNDLFPGGTAISPGGIVNGGFTGNNPLSGQGTLNPAYNGTVISLVSRTDANTADDVGITSGNQALRVSMKNVSQGDGNTSFDRPAMLTIKAQDFWGVADSRFDTWEMVRANPDDFDVSIDCTFLADEMPDTFDPTPISSGPVHPYARLGFISMLGGNFDEAPANVLQGPDALNLSGGDNDGDSLPNFTDPDYVDPGNPFGLPGFGVAGVIQRRYVFPASAMTFPNLPLAGAPDNGNRESAGGSSNAYMFGFVWNGSWELNQSASFIVDNIRFKRHFIEPNAADFNMDGIVDELDWEILSSNLNSPTASTFAEGDIGSFPGNIAEIENPYSPGKVDFLDFVAFDRFWERYNGGSGSFTLGGRGAAGVPEPTTFFSVCLAMILLGMQRMRLNSPLSLREVDR